MFGVVLLSLLQAVGFSFSFGAIIKTCELSL